MNLKTLLSILMIASLLLILPVLQAPNSVTLIQNTAKAVVIPIKTPSVQITLDHNFPVFLNVSFINPITNTSTLVTLKGFIFSSVLVLDLEQGRGYYLFEFLSSQVSTVEIKQQGLFFASILILIFIVTANVIIVIRDYVWIYEV